MAQQSLYDTKPDTRPTPASARSSNADTRQQLSIYLNDHRAGAEGAEALARRSARANADNVVGEYLSGEFLADLRDDRAVLEALRTRFEVRSNPVKQLMSRLGEFVGRAKFNGSLSGPTPLGRVLELEALIAGVNGKQQLWRIAMRLPGIDADLFEERFARSEVQLKQLQDLHRWASWQAFVTNDTITP